MTFLASRKAVEEALDQYFAGKISVEEAFRLAYGPDPRTAAAQGNPAAVASASVGSIAPRPAGTGRPSRRRRKGKK